MVVLVFVLVISMLSCLMFVIIERLCFISFDELVIVIIWCEIFSICVFSCVLSRCGVIRLILGLRLLMLRNSWFVYSFCSVMMVCGFDSEYEFG